MKQENTLMGKLLVSCPRMCYSEAMRVKNPLNYKECRICKKVFYAYPSEVKMGLGKFCSLICYWESEKGSAPWNKGTKGLLNMNEKNGAWKGNKVSYGALHDYIKYYFPKPKLCQNCNIKPPYDLSNISNEYKRDFSDWEWLCRTCHMRKDGRLNRLLQIRHKTKKVYY